MTATSLATASDPPDPSWPGGARLALSFVLNYEEGGERTPLEGDLESESYLHEVVARRRRSAAATSTPSRCSSSAAAPASGASTDLPRARPAADRVRGGAGARAQSAGGSRDGRRRLGGGQPWLALDRLPGHARGGRAGRHAPRHRGHRAGRAARVRSAGTRGASRRPRAASSSRRAAFSTTPTRTPTSFPTGSRSPGRQHLVIPYTLDANDFKFLIPNGFVTAGDFHDYLVDSFERLYEDGGRMMSVGLHCRIVGRPGRAVALDRFLAYVKAERRRVGDDARRDRPPLARAPPTRLSS